MKITIQGFIPQPKLEERIRSVPLKRKKSEDPAVFVYQNARISFRDMYPDELNPGSKYLLQRQFELQRELDKILSSELGVDMFNLLGAYVIRDETTAKIWTLMPPIVEVTQENMCYADTRGDISYPAPTTVRMNVIVDGLHRLYLARVRDIPCRVVHIDAIPKDYPFYALPNTWDEVKIGQETPPQDQKKNYRRQDSFGLYRDFNVLDCGEPREPGT